MDRKTKREHSEAGDEAGDEAKGEARGAGAAGHEDGDTAAQPSPAKRARSVASDCASEEGTPASKVEETKEGTMSAAAVAAAWEAGCKSLGPCYGRMYSVGDDWTIGVSKSAWEDAEGELVEGELAKVAALPRAAGGGYALTALLEFGAHLPEAVRVVQSKGWAACLSIHLSDSQADPDDVVPGCASALELVRILEFLNAFEWNVPCEPLPLAVLAAVAAHPGIVSVSLTLEGVGTRRTVAEEVGPAVEVCSTIKGLETVEVDELFSGDLGCRVASALVGASRETLTEVRVADDDLSGFGSMPHIVKAFREMVATIGRCTTLETLSVDVAANELHFGGEPAEDEDAEVEVLEMASALPNLTTLCVGIASKGWMLGGGWVAETKEQAESLSDEELLDAVMPRSFKCLCSLLEDLAAFPMLKYIRVQYETYQNWAGARGAQAVKDRLARALGRRRRTLVLEWGYNRYNSGATWMTRGKLTPRLDSGIVMPMLLMVGTDRVRATPRSELAELLLRLSGHRAVHLVRRHEAATAVAAAAIAAAAVTTVAAPGVATVVPAPAGRRPKAVLPALIRRIISYL